MLTKTNSSSYRDRHALVIGGSMAGLLAARVLSDHFRAGDGRRAGQPPGGTRVPQGRPPIQTPARVPDAGAPDRREALPQPRSGPVGGGRRVDRLRRGLRDSLARGLRPPLSLGDTVPAVEPRAPGARRPRARGLYTQGSLPAEDGRDGPSGERRSGGGREGPLPRRQERRDATPESRTDP